MRDLVEIAIDNVREEKLEDVADKAELNAEERLLDILAAAFASAAADGTSTTPAVWSLMATQRLTESSSRTREKLRQQLREGKLDDRTVEIDVRERNFPSFEILTNQGVEEMDVNIKGHVAEHLRAAHQEAEDEGQRGLRIPDPGRRAAPH